MKSIKFLFFGSMTMGLISLAVVGDALFAMQTAGDDSSSRSSSHSGPVRSFLLPEDLVSQADSGISDQSLRDFDDAADMLREEFERSNAELEENKMNLVHSLVRADPQDVADMEKNIADYGWFKEALLNDYTDAMQDIADKRAAYVVYLAELEANSQSSPMKREDFVRRNAAFLSFGLPEGMEDLDYLLPRGEEEDEEEVVVPSPAAPNPAAARGCFFDDSDDEDRACV